MNKPITIVGGGLAGLTLGVTLRRQGVPVTVWEAGDYPRHKVCGEFISGRGLEVLQELGLTQIIGDRGGRWAHTAAFYAGRRGPVRQTLAPPALCVSRYVLDESLADEFRRCGGELRTRERWRDPFDADGVVRATGRRPHPADDGNGWVGLKAHADAVPMEADLELHVLADGYVGLCRLADRVNVCGLFRVAQPAHDLRSRWREYLEGPRDSLLHQRLAGVRMDEQAFCATAGLSLDPRRADPDECALGDAHTMIAPTTGNGMSMALEAAQLAAAPVLRYSRGLVAWPQVRAEVGAACDARFRPRLRQAARLQSMMLGRWRQRALMGVCRCCPAVVRLLFARTR